MLKFLINFFSKTDSDDFPDIPAEIRAAHQFSISHRSQLLESEMCGCFYCRKIFPPSAIADWIDEPNHPEQTALCPHCGIDSVIGDRSGFPITQEFMEQMHHHWF